jgi:hypothetical protein
MDIPNYMTFADKIIQFNKQLDFDGTLPAGIRIMNPFKGKRASDRDHGEIL